MKSIEKLKEEKKFVIERVGIDGGHGYLTHPLVKGKLTIRFSFGGDWDHVSVSHPRRTPGWDEMCLIKDIFFDKDECVLQYHPSETEYVNMHPHCLHLWKPQNVEFPIPKKVFV